MQTEEFQAAILAWFDREGRKNLPWRIEPSPYRVWVSEIMLQQTQVSTVIPYFLRFMERFPSLRSLAEAEDEDVMSHWAGLGYYARGRNILKAAKIAMREHGGELPSDVSSLMRLPGIGRSTAGAILSMGFGLRGPILDGNVKRVLCRFAAIDGWPGESQIERELWRISEMRTPSYRVDDYTQAMMDLGATVCTRTKPRCSRCPLREACQALKLGLTDTLPASRPSKPTPARSCWMLILCDVDGKIYVEKRPPAGIWGGLWSPPQFEDRGELDAWLLARGIDVALAPLPQRRHTFSHFHLDYTPLAGRVERTARIAEDTACWMLPGQSLALPAPISRLFAELASAPDL